jgi:hypothetical protein
VTKWVKNGQNWLKMAQNCSKCVQNMFLWLFEKIIFLIFCPKMAQKDLENFSLCAPRGAGGEFSSRNRSQVGMVRGDPKIFFCQKVLKSA